MVRAAKVAPAFQFYPTSYPSDDEDPPAPSVARHKHIRFNNDGQVSEHHSYLASAASPAKPNPFPEPDATQWNSEHIPDIISHPYIDPAYQHELDLMNPDLPKRKRTKSVSRFVQNQCVHILICLPTTGHSASQLDT